MSFRGMYIVMSLIIIFISSSRNEAAQKLTVVYTNSLNGNIDFCHCKDDPKGGLVKRATEIKKIKAERDNVVMFETGDFFNFDKEPILAKYIIQAYRYIKYDAILFGEQEFSLGVPEFAAYKKSLPFICNNILLAIAGKSENIFKRFIIIQKMMKEGNILKIGVIGTISKDALKNYSNETTENIKVLNQVDEIRKDIDRLKKDGIDFIILLSHSGYDIDIELSKKFKDVDLIIGGHSQTLLITPIKEGYPIVVQAGSNGSHIGILDIVIDDGKIIKYWNSFRLPDDAQPKDDPVIRKMIMEYHTKINKVNNQ